MTVRQLAAAALVLAVGAAPALAQPRSERNGSKLLGTFQSIVARANSSTVRIQCDDKDVALGTIVFSDGWILTKASELRGAVSVRFGDGSVLDGEVVSVHKPTDLALIKVNMKGLKPVAFTDSKKEPVGNWLAAAGTSVNPTAVGIVSVATRQLTGLDAREGLNNNRGFLGILLAREEESDSGAKIDEVTKGGAAAKAGLKKGDVVLEVNGMEVSNTQALREMLADYRPGDKVKLKVRRDEETLDFQATLTGQPAGTKSRSDIQNGMGGELSGRRTGFPSVLQTDMILDPKNCGGPVVDLDGKVLGISIARAGRVETWILPSEVIRPLLADMKAGKYPAIVKKVKKVLGEK